MGQSYEVAKRAALGYGLGMDQTAECPLMPAKTRPLHRFNPANAREMAARAIAVRRANREKPKEPETVTINERPTEQPNNGVTLRVREIDKEITRTTRAMAKATEPKDVQAFSMALDRLYNIWSLLTGHPRPGVRKDVKKRGPASYAQPQE